MGAKERSQYNPIRSVDRALEIIEFLAGGDYQSLARISGAVKLHKSTVFNLLTTLMIKGYAEQDSETGKYRLTGKVYRLGRQSLEQRSLWSEGAPYLQGLKKRYPEKVFLAAIQGEDVVFLGEENQGLITNIEILNIYQTVLKGVGRLRSFLANPREELNQTGKIVLTQGFYIDDGGDTAGYRTVMAPIRNHLGMLAGVLVLAGREAEMPMARILDLGKELKRISGDIARRLGFEEA